MFNVRPENRISVVTLGNSVRECLLNRRLLWFSHLERMEKGSWYSKYSKFKVCGS